MILEKWQVRTYCVPGTTISPRFVYAIWFVDETIEAQDSPGKWVAQLRF